MNKLKERENNDIKGMCVPIFGVLAQQNPMAILSINRLLNIHNFTNIIEFGTHAGGLSILLSLYCLQSNILAKCDNSNEPTLYINNTHHKQPKHFFTFDNVIRDSSIISLIKQMGSTFEQLDLLNDESAIKYIKFMIGSVGRTLVFCDNGNKLKELEIYSESLKSGDIIMAHDWAKDSEMFEYNKKNGIWHGWEVRWEDGEGKENKFGIREICEKNNIEQVYSEEFDKCAWFCGRKK